MFILPDERRAVAPPLNSCLHPSELTATSDTASGEINNSAGQWLAGEDIHLLAETTTNRTYLEANSRTSSVSNNREKDRLLLSTLSGNASRGSESGSRTAWNETMLESGGEVRLHSGRVSAPSARVCINSSLAAFMLASIFTIHSSSFT
ncbi:hypothetical protein [Pantoea sp. KPR_PJ]|uniref:hypothetical protein n=1 Tax=Pantoea sp. KPR_PJ TaxID=2738375 RepID=UPI003527380E